MPASKTTPAPVEKLSEWHALPVTEVREKLHSPKEGLSDTEVANRQQLHGRNIFTKKKERTIFDSIFDQFKSAISIILLIAALITLTLAHYVDAVVIALALTVAVVVGVVQEGKASRAFQTLANSQVRTATVFRQGKKHVIEAAELVQGDVVVIQGGMQVPADIRLTEAKQLTINEATLTGEWLAVEKSVRKVSVGAPTAERSSMAFQGTFVAAGYGTGIVVATGDDTVVGRLAADVQGITSEQTPLQWEMQRLSRAMLIIVLFLIVSIFAIGVVQGENIETMLLTAIAIAVASIPEGLPAAVTIVLAVGMEALLKRGGLVRNLLAAETLGSTTYILTDKTGTLTEARMAITGIMYKDCTEEKDGLCDWHEGEYARDMLDIALAASDGFLDEEQNDEEAYVVRGEPMERAILESAHERGISLHGASMRGRRIDYLAFTSENRFAAGLSATKDSNVVCLNGAPEYVLASATHAGTEKGEVSMSEKMRTSFAESIEVHTKEGKRIIAVAYKKIKEKRLPSEVKEIMSDLVFVGFLVFRDPVREGVRDAIKGVQGAGASVRLVTGDNPQTALAVAREVGIARSYDIAVTGNDIAEMDDAELLEALRHTYVFARVLPRQKMRLAQILQKSGEIVAMTGDGINDAPALQKANIGVAIGSGTEVAKEASDLVLVKDSFATIYAAIEEGRRIISNLRKIVGYLLSTSLSEAILIAAALVTGGMVPILPAQILWANLIEEGLMSVAFAFERGDKDAMKQKPQDIHAEGILSRTMLLFMAFMVTVLSVLLLTLYGVLRALDVPTPELRSMMFLAVAIDSLFVAFSFRSFALPMWKIPLRTNIFFGISFLINIVLLGLVLYVPFLQYLLSYEPLSAAQFGLVAIYGISALLVVEVLKWLFFMRRKNAL